MLDAIFLIVTTVIVRARCSATPSLRPASEESHMIEPIFGLIVSLLLGGYLLLTLIHPEKF